MKVATILLALLACPVVPATPQSVPDPPATIRRLEGLARVWGYAKYFHPALDANAEIDWDAALLASIPLVRQATNSEEYARAINVMLDRLGDPVSRAYVPSAAPLAVTADTTFDFRLAPGHIMVVTVGDYYALFDPSVPQRLDALAKMLPGARGIVLDLRSRTPVDAFGRSALTGTLADLERLLVRDTLETAGYRHRVYYGYDNPGAFSSGQYRSGFMVEHGARITPAPRHVNVPVVFLMNRYSAELPSTTALQVAGRARIVYQGDFRQHDIGESERLSLDGGVVAQVRQGEKIFADGRSAEFRPDVIVPARPGKEDVALTRAIALAGSSGAARPAPRRVSSVPAPIRERAYQDQSLPPLGLRLLAAFRLWATIEYFHPYKALMERSWDSALADMIPAFEQATTSEAYIKAVATMATRLDDSHAYLAGSLFNRYLIGTGYPPIRVRMIENIPIVTFIFDTLAARAAGVEVGDEVLSVDGVPAATRFDSTARYISVSTRQHLVDKASLAFLSGADGSTVTLELRDAAGRLKRATLTRRHEDVTTLYHRERRGEIITLLPGDVGYVDLDRLTLDMVDSMFRRLAATRAIIFDMRGYPAGTIWAIAPRLTDTSRVVALIETPMIGHRSPGAATELVRQIVDPDSTASHYRGKIIMLIDERAVSQAEHTGLYLKAVSHAVFVGSPTAGADGEITTTVLPGGITVGFTGQSIRFPDGRQLQRIGLIPDVKVTPTIRGIREGRDEVLEAALKLATPQ
jgi:C-terminal processing protease CtpA/Prc